MQKLKDILRKFRGVGPSSAQDSSLSGGEQTETLFEQVRSFAFALLLVFVFRSSCFESFKIPSGSMIPTLAIGDYIFVSKFAYGWKVPFSELFLEAPLFITEQQLPERGDVIVFRYPRDPDIYYIKRVVGRPGDTIEVKDQQLILNGVPVQRTALSADTIKEIEGGEVLADPQYTVRGADFFLEKIEKKTGSGVFQEHWMMHDPSRHTGDPFGPINQFGPITVPQDSVFVMGDNRDVSSDSRFWGFVPTKNIAGKAKVIWFSFWVVDFAQGPIYFHPSRMGTVIR